MMTIGTLVAGRYEIRDRLGRGSQGEVLEAFDQQLGRLVALKILPICGDSPEERAERRLRFQTEARAAARLQHPGIVAVFDSGETENEAWIAMELVIGQTLRDALRRPERPPLREALRIGRELLDALEAAHARGVVHRDVKACNIMLAMDAGDGHGRVRLTDFGIASLVVGQKPGDIEFVGTPAVMAPEQIRGEACDERTDLWSAGVILYELLTGTPPFAGGVPAIYSAVLARQPLPPSLLNPDLPLAFDAVMETALAKSIDRRFQSAGQMAAAIDAVAGDLLDPRPAEMALPAPGIAARPKKAGSGRASTALAFLAGAAAASAGFAWRDSGWRGWPAHTVVAAALPSEPATTAPVTEDHGIARNDDGEASAPVGEPLFAALPVEPTPADAGLAVVETANRPAGVPGPVAAVLAEEPASTAALPDPMMAEVPLPGTDAEPFVPLAATVAEALAAVAAMAEDLPFPGPGPGAAMVPMQAASPAVVRLAEVPAVGARDPAPVAPPLPDTGEPTAPSSASVALAMGPAASDVGESPPGPGAAAAVVAEPAVQPPPVASCVGRPPQFATGNHPGYGRVVLRWSQPVRYRATVVPGGLRLEFAEPFCIAVSRAVALPRNVRAVAVAPGVIEINAAPGSTIRHFTLDRRTVIDVADGGAR